MIALGVILIVVAFIAAVVGAGAFTARNPLPPLLDWIGFICFFGFWVPGIAGVVLVIVGLVHRGQSG